MTHIVKRKGHKESFDERKVYASVYSACLAVRIQDEEAELMANLVSREVKKWFEERGEVSSKDISEQVEKELKHLNKTVAFMYSTHKDVS